MRRLVLSTFALLVLVVAAVAFATGSGEPTARAQAKPGLTPLQQRLMSGFASRALEEQTAPALVPQARVHAHQQVEIDQLQRYIDNGGFWREEVPESGRYFKMANRDYLQWSAKLGFIASPAPVVLAKGRGDKALAMRELLWSKFWVGTIPLLILALVLVARRATYPQALMKPYRKGER